MNEMQTLLHDTVTRLFTDLVTQDLLETAETGVWPGELWDAVEGCGLLRPHIPESAGGADGTWADAFVIIRAAGRHCVPLPIAETLLAGWLLHGAGLEIPNGPLTVIPEVLDGDLVRDKQLTYIARRVPWGRCAPYAVAVLAEGTDLHVCLVPTDKEHGVEGENLAREPRDDLNFHGARLAASGAASIAPEPLLGYGAMLRAAQMAGALDYLLEQSVQYALEREQFGRPIGSFQIIQQELAKMAGEAAAAGTAAAVAFRAADTAAADAGHDPTFEMAVAKIRAGQAAEVATSIAHQVHGAIGFTYEHRLQFATRRLWSWRAEFGNEEYWAALIGRAALARGADALWGHLTAR